MKSLCAGALLTCCVLAVPEAEAARLIGDLVRPGAVSAEPPGAGPIVDLEPEAQTAGAAPLSTPQRRYSLQEGIGAAAGFALAGATVAGASALGLLWAQGVPDASREGAPVILGAALLGAWLVGPLGACLALGIPPLKGSVWLAALGGALAGVLALVVPPVGVVALFLGPALGVLWAAENVPSAFQPDDDAPAGLAFRF
ncbi:MAG: hypothetical protein RL653_3208 [Pseudomonadota bacterium]|jgi:hypothetical protein